MLAAAHLCDPYATDDDKFFVMDFAVNFTVNSIHDILRNISITKKETITACRMIPYSKNCLHSFKTIVTEDGVCYTFNAVNSDQIYTNM